MAPDSPSEIIFSFRPFLSPEPHSGRGLGTREALTASAETLLAFSRTGEREDSILALQLVFVCVY